MYTLHIYNPADEKTYSLSLTKEDYERGLTDLSFAQTLLNAAEKEAALEENGLSNSNDNEKETRESTSVSDEMEQSSAESADSRNVWSYNATVALINSMESHSEDLHHATKRKHVYTNISNDILSLGHKFNAVACQTKWKTLVRSYKSAKDHKIKTGRGPSRFMFYELIDNILGDKPTNKCLHSMESSSSIHLESEKEEADEKEELRSELKETKRRKTSESCIKLKEKEYQKKEERHRERMELEQTKIAIEERKIALLEQLLKK